MSNQCDTEIKRSTPPVQSFPSACPASHSIPRTSLCVFEPGRCSLSGNFLLCFVTVEFFSTSSRFGTALTALQTSSMNRLVFLLQLACLQIHSNTIQHKRNGTTVDFCCFKTTTATNRIVLLTAIKRPPLISPKRMPALVKTDTNYQKLPSVKVAKQLDEGEG